MRMNENSLQPAWLPGLHPLGRQHRGGLSRYLRQAPLGRLTATQRCLPYEDPLHDQLQRLDQFDRFRDAIRAAGKAQHAVARLQCVPDRLRVINSAVAGGAEIQDVANGKGCSCESYGMRVAGCTIQDARGKLQVTGQKANSGHRFSRRSRRKRRISPCRRQPPCCCFRICFRNRRRSALLSLCCPSEAAVAVAADRSSADCAGSGVGSVSSKSLPRRLLGVS